MDMINSECLRGTRQSIISSWRNFWPQPGVRTGIMAALTATIMPNVGLAQSATPGSVIATISDALSSVPGVVVQNFFGSNDQPRIRIRGSGLQQNPVERGVLVLQNGLPINRADGSYLVGLVNPRQAQFTEVYCGCTANRLGAPIFGGALNFVSPTGSSAPGLKSGIEGGSFGQLSAFAQAAAKRGNFDGLVQVSFSHRDGFRDYDESDRLNVDTNVGAELTDNLSSRLFVAYTDLSFDVAGPMTQQKLRRNARRVLTGPTVRPNPTSLPRFGAFNPGSNVACDRPQHQAEQFRIGNRTTATFGAHLVDVALGYKDTGDAFRFPIPAGIRETEGGDFTSVVRYAYSPRASRPLPLFEATAKYIGGWANRKNFANNAGSKGLLFGRSELEASTLSLHAGLNIPGGAVLTISPAIAFARAERDNADIFGAAIRPTIAFNQTNPTQPLPRGAVPGGAASYTRTYSGWSPSLGITIQPTENNTFFAAVSRSFEPPPYDDLTATVNGTPNSSPGRPDPGNPALPAAAFRTPGLKAQRTTTSEAGWRGRYETVAWNMVAYSSWVRNTLLSLRDESGTPLGAVNADKTGHLGLELGLRAYLTEKLSGRPAYTYQNFSFDGDSL